jgi:hypothetical protein
MSDDGERAIEIERVVNRKPSHCDMDEAFCARMFWAIEAGLESAPVGIITAPGTKYPRCVLTETLPLASSLSDTDR